MTTTTAREQHLKTATSRLDQGSTWTSSTGRTHRISRMSHTHAANTARWLETNATSLLMQRERELHGDDVPSGRIAEILANPAAQMRLTKLHQALTTRARITTKEGLHEPDPS